MPETQHIVATLTGVCKGVNTITRLHFMEDAGTQAQRQTLAIAIRDRWLPEWKTGCSSQMNWTAITISRVQDPNDSPFMLPINVVGGGSGLLPMQIGLQWNLFTGQAGKQGRGRIFLPGLASTTNVNGQLDGSLVASLNTAVTTLTNRWAAGGTEAWHLGVSSRVGLAVRAVTSISYNQIFSALRSRKLGVGI